MMVVFLVILVTALLGILMGILFYTPGASRVPPRPKTPKKNKTYI